MSDREGSPSRSRSRSLSEKGSLVGSDNLSDQGSPRLSGQRSRSRSRSKGSYRGNSRSPSRSYKRHSRSSSRSRSKRYYSRSRSRSPYYKRRSRHSRSRSRSYSPDGRKHYSDRGQRYRSHSRSPMSRRRRHKGNRENPTMSRCLGVFGLSLYTQERDLRDVFTRYGPLEEMQIVYDHQTGRSRGFAFIYFRNTEDAAEAKERATGMEIDGRKIRIDFSITERAHTPTPGIYLGKPTTSSYKSSRRSPSPYYGRSSGRRGYSRSRSRSRSFSPRMKKEICEVLKNET